MAASEAEASWQQEAKALRDRLEAAERVCVLYAWTPARHDTNREKALHEVWAAWSELPGTSIAPEDHPELSDRYIAALARKRDETRARTLKRIYEEATDG